MSIQPIDAQLMITRAADLARDASVQMKKTELMQDFAAVQAAVLDKEEKKRVGTLAETEAAALRADKDNHGNGDGESDEEREREADDAPELPFSGVDEARFILETNKQIDIKG